MNNINFVELAQLISSLAMVVSVIYLAKQISEEKIAKKMEFGFNLTDRPVSYTHLRAHETR